MDGWMDGDTKGMSKCADEIALVLKKKNEKILFLGNKTLSKSIVHFTLQQKGG